MMTEFIDTVHKLILNKMQKDGEPLEAIEALQNVLQEYEIHIKTIEEQLDQWKKDHAHLRTEITCLIEENKSLYWQIRNNSDGNTENLDVVDNLTQQLTLALEERETLESLWKLSLEEVESLKNKLHQYSSGEQLVRARSKLSNSSRLNNMASLTSIGPPQPWDSYFRPRLITGAFS